MEIIYVLTVIWLLTVTMLVKKSDNKQNILLALTVSIISFTAYNVLISFIFFIININFTLLALSIVNIIVSAIITYLIYRKKQIQKYTIKKIDIIFLITLLAVIIIIGLYQYGFVPKIKYETTDPAIHFNLARELYDIKKLQIEGLMPAAGVNTEILFDTFDFIIHEENFYYLYMIFDLIILYLIGAIIYLGITNKIKSNKKSIITMIFTIMFICGYPLNSMIFGFQYLSLGILYMATLISIGVNIKSKELRLLPICIEFFLLNFGLFFSYYLFVPVVYIAVGIYILFDIVKNTNMHSKVEKEDIIKITSILIVPTIIGFCYFVLPGLLKTGQTAIGCIGQEGYIYRDLYSNFILIAPFVIFYIIYNFKNKNNSLSTIMFIITLLFTMYLLIMGLKGKVSSYYYFKMYYLLYMLAFYMSIKSMHIIIDNKNELYVYAFSIVFLVIFIIAYTGFDYKISSIKAKFNTVNGINSFAGVYVFNQNKISKGTDIYTNNQIEAIKYLLNETKEDKSKILVVGNELQMLWAHSVWRITDETTEAELRKPRELDVGVWLENNKKKYLIYFDTSKEIEKETEKYKAIYDEEDVVILEKK